MAAGSVVVELLAKTGSFDTDIDRSTKAAEKRFESMKKTIDVTSLAIGGALGAAAVSFGVKIHTAIEELDRFNDVADATGASIEKISALEDIGMRAGNSFESVNAALLRFNQQLKNTDPDNKTSRILQQIGLDADKLRQMDPADALHKTARALAEFADDGDKARLVQELFGKSVREVGPLLKDLAEAEELHGTVTEEAAKQAEAFNKQLAQMHKNSSDLARELATGMLPVLDEALRKFRDADILGVAQTLLTGTDINKAQREILSLTDSILTVQGTIDKAKAKVAEGGFGGWLAGLNLPGYEQKLKDLNAQLRTARSLLAVNEPKFFSGTEPPKPSVGPVASKEKAGPKGKDPDADFKQYLNQLEQQIQKVGELTTMEKLLDDIRRGHLTVTPKQEAQLKALAGEIDAEKEALRIAKERQALRNKDYQESADALRQIDEADRARLRTLLDSGPTAQLEKQRKEMEYLAKAFEDGRINAEQFNDAAIGYLHLTGDAVKETKSMTEELGMTFASAFENAVIGGSSLSDVFKGLLQDIARVILRMQVIEPLMKQLKDSIGADGDGWWKSLVGSVAGSFSMGAGDALGMSIGGTYGSSTQAGLDNLINSLPSRAIGGPVSANEPYMVGERGQELFVPRTAGMIVPNSALRSSGAEPPVIVNQTTGRVDNVQRQPMPDGREAWILQELSNPNSKVSRTLQHRYNLRPAR